MGDVTGTGEYRGGAEPRPPTCLASWDWEARCGVRSTSPADGLRGSSVHPRSSRRVHEDGCANSASVRCRSNDHMVFSVPWLDGPVALAAVMEHSGEMTLATTVALSVVRGPVPVAKTLGAIDRLSGGRLVVGGRSGLVARRLRGRRSRLRGTLATVRRVDRRAAGAVATGQCAVRRPLLFDRGSFVAAPARTTRLDRRSGSGAGARTPGFVAWRGSPTAGWHRPTTRRRSCSAKRGKPFARSWPITGRTPDTFPNALATMWCYITDDRAEADRILRERVDSHRAPTRGDAPRTSPDRPARAVRREADRLRRRQACNASSSGRSPTRCTSSSASGTKCDRSSALRSPVVLARGNRLVVTRDGRPVAELRPLHRPGLDAATILAAGEHLHHHTRRTVSRSPRRQIQLRALRTPSTSPASRSRR